MRVTVLIENTTESELVSEHGLSLYIEHEDKRILLDSGQSDAFYDNAGTLGINLDDLTLCVLSHGHYDHSGGYEKLLEENKEVKVYSLSDAFGEYYSENGGLHYIGVPKNVTYKYMDRFILSDGVRELSKGIYIIPHSTEGLENTGKRTGLYKKCGDEYVPDNFSHELSLVFDTPKGLVIFNSCSHGGIVNIINEVKKVLPKKPINAFIGGLHMKGTMAGKEVSIFSENEIKDIVEFLKHEGLEKIYTGHCTGTPALDILVKYGHNMIDRLYTGKIISL